jgi:hypothetical protein
MRKPWSSQVQKVQGASQCEMTDEKITFISVSRITRDANLIITVDTFHWYSLVPQYLWRCVLYSVIIMFESCNQKYGNVLCVAELLPAEDRMQRSSVPFNSNCSGHYDVTNK